MSSPVVIHGCTDHNRLRVCAYIFFFCKRFKVTLGCGILKSNMWPTTIRRLVDDSLNGLPFYLFTFFSLYDDRGKKNFLHNWISFAMVNSFGGRSWWCVIVQNSSLSFRVFIYIQLPEFISRICFWFVSYISARKKTRDRSSRAGCFSRNAIGSQWINEPELPQYTTDGRLLATTLQILVGAKK